MDRKALVVFLLAVATATAGVLPAPKVLEGPSSKTTIIGPDGSKISAFAPGGKILLEENAGPVLQGAPEVVAVAGVAQPAPETPEVAVVAEVAEVAPPVPVAPNQASAVIPVVEITSEGDSVAVEVDSVPVSVPVEGGEAKDLAKSAVTGDSTQIDGTTVPAIVQEPEESKTEALEGATDPGAAEKVTESPFSVEPLVKSVDPVVAEGSESQPLVGYINDSPFYVPQFKGLEGEYVPENLYEQEILGW